MCLNQQKGAKWPRLKRWDMGGHWLLREGPLIGKERVWIMGVLPSGQSSSECKAWSEVSEHLDYITRRGPFYYLIQKRIDGWVVAMLCIFLCFHLPTNRNLLRQKRGSGIVVFIIIMWHIAIYLADKCRRIFWLLIVYLLQLMTMLYLWALDFMILLCAMLKLCMKLQCKKFNIVKFWLQFIYL